MRDCPISVVIPVRNEGRRIRESIDSLLAGRSCRFPLEIIVVDDDSSDGACSGLQDAALGHDDAEVVVLRLPRWSGIPCARNLGAELARHPILVITDGNARFPRDWNEPIWRRMRPRRILCATIVDMVSPFRGYGCELQLPSMGIAWIPVPGAFGGQVPVSPCGGTIIETALFRHLGGFDEALPIYGSAEPEFSLRAWLSGCEIVQMPELEIGHWFRPRPQFDAYRASIQPVLLRNCLRFACCYLPPAALQDTYAHYGAHDPARIADCVRSLVHEGVWQRRAQLRSLPRDFAWFSDRFASSRRRVPS